ncbi:hypothetical protein, conserved [Trypanosoma brucei gambiense DAL972]|uniref:DUF1935 domain-containing protein n=1 Tax=Trypanosoma brucei gambiense (strain MHOM/CI/86/DAL972) TaxID=679716 RepID=D0A1U7_TRYB9|nr:hypothetical protein, conserved [Trypanosoma brucei gambiense DAL972]CBH15240.1 hypothetical protein, conserved [Trypanosoma brucei gambiense DAL972]|eukprot:XP_011777505.1 hypothetical protein, conserved [Trypanosoma brucei gambiense DAL972]
MTELVPEAEVTFNCGSPSFPYVRVYRCFKTTNSGMLYRLEDDKGRWAFYNDTPLTVFNVYVKFNADSVVTSDTDVALEMTQGEWDYWATTVVLPGHTQRFVEGTISSFLLNFASEGELAKDVTFVNGTPTVGYDRVYRCFKQNANGMLFRLVKVERPGNECVWNFYNDSRELSVEVELTLIEKDSAKPLGNTQVIPPPDGVGVALYKIVVPPLKTVPFLRGHPRFSKQSYVAKSMYDENMLDASEITFENGQPDRAVIDYPRTKVFRGFNNNGNGLAFLLVDPEEKKWAFYNDTTNYNVTATVRFAAGSVYKAAANTRVEVDPAVEGGTVCTITVMPLATELFITEGNPEQYQISLSAECSTGPKPEENPDYQNGQPDTKVMLRWEKVYRCFKNRGNGLLFRLVGDNDRRWGFYNDTTDFIITVTVSFENGETVKTLGNTSVSEDPELGKVFTLEVAPLSTEVFVFGDLSGYKTRFAARSVRCA